MTYPDIFILTIMGAIFLSVGIGIFAKGKSDEKKEYDTLTSRTDMKEFIEHSPEQFRAGAFKLGGMISMIVGLVMLGIASGLRLWG